MRRFVLLLTTAALLVACSSDANSGNAKADKATSTTKASDPAAPVQPLVFNGQGNNLDAYATEPADDGTFATQRVFTTIDDDPENGRDINAQICFLPPTDDGEQWFIAGEDTGQDDPNRPAGWGIFRLDGDTLGSLEATQIGKLTTTFQPSVDGPENYGCGALSDGRLVTTDVGNQAEGDGDGQLTIWFPPTTGGEYPDFDEVAHCKLDVGLPTGQSILVKDDDIYVAAARGGVYRYTGPFPTSDDAAGGCGKTDATGAPMADEVTKETFIEPGANGLATPAGLAPAPDDGFYVSSVFSGVINEYDAEGAFVRTILKPAEGDTLGEEPYATGTPLGIAVGPDGTLYYADIGIVIGDGSVGPGDSTGTVRRITFEDGEPQPPETIATDLAFPDGIGVLTPPS